MPRSIVCLALFVIASAALADDWSPISVANAPTARTAHSGVFTRIDVTDQMIVWGGQDSDSLPFANTGGRWKRSTNSWTATTTTSAPSGRQGQPAVWTGHEMIVWGGDAGTDTQEAGRFVDVSTSGIATALGDVLCLGSLPMFVLCSTMLADSV